MKEKIKWLEKYAPLGFDVEKEVKAFIVEMVLVTIQTLFFFPRYMYALDELYTRRAGKRVLIEGTVIQGFDTLVEGLFTVSVLVAVVTLVQAAIFYAYHRSQGSNMLYLMKRLPDKWELWRRCLTLPIAGAVIVAVWALVLRMLYFSIYIIFTPSQCLPL